MIPIGRDGGNWRADARHDLLPQLRRAHQRPRAVLPVLRRPPGGVPRRAPAPPRTAPLPDSPPRRRGPAARRRGSPPGRPRTRPRRRPSARPADPLRRRRLAADPQAGELTELLRQRLALPGIVAAAIAGGVSAGDRARSPGCCIALITPDASILGSLGIDASLVTEAFRQAVGTLLTAMVEEPGLLVSGTRRIHPLLLLAIPLGALILTTRWQLYRTEGAPPLARLGWAALVAVPFALLMLVFAVIGGDSDTTRISPSAGSAFALGLLWGVLGGLIGAATKLPLDEAVARIPRRPRTVLDAALADAAPARGGAGDLHGDRARRLADPGRRGTRAACAPAARRRPR